MWVLTRLICVVWALLYMTELTPSMHEAGIVYTPYKYGLSRADGTRPVDSSVTKFFGWCVYI